jgi:autoinducer 2-degrading protein
MTKTAVLVAFEVKGGQMTPFLEIIRAHAAGTLDEEPGCEQFEVMTTKDGSNAVHLHEVYVDDNAYAVHAQSQHLANVRERYQELIVGRTIAICDL